MILWYYCFPVLRRAFAAVRKHHRHRHIKRAVAAKTATIATKSSVIWFCVAAGLSGGGLWLGWPAPIQPLAAQPSFGPVLPEEFYALTPSLLFSPVITTEQIAIKENDIRRDVPEPNTLILLASAIAALAAWRLTVDKPL